MSLLLFVKGANSMGIRIHPTAEVSEKAKIGDGTGIWPQAQVREDVDPSAVAGQVDAAPVAGGGE